MGLFNFGVANNYSFKSFIDPFVISNIHHSCLGSNVIAMLGNVRVVFVDSIYRCRVSVGSFVGVGRVIAFNAGRYIVGTLSNGIYYSDDGCGSFSLSDAPVGGGTLVWGVAGNSSVVCAMTGTGMKYSLNNGQNWLSSATVNPAPWGGSVNSRGPNCLKWISELGLFVLVGGSGATNYVAWSVDGNNWASVSFPVGIAGDFLQSVAFFKDKIYVAGNQGGVYQLNSDFGGVASVSSASSVNAVNSYYSSDLVSVAGVLYLITGNDSLSTNGAILALGGGGFNLLNTSTVGALPYITGHEFFGGLNVVGKSSFLRAVNQLPI